MPASFKLKKAKMNKGIDCDAKLLINLDGSKKVIIELFFFRLLLMILKSIALKCFLFLKLKYSVTTRRDINEL